MTNLQHAKILQLYLDRLTLSDLQRIIHAKSRSLDAAMNLGSRAQAIYAEDEEQTIQSAVSSMLPTDIARIEAGIAEYTKPITT